MRFIVAHTGARRGYAVPVILQRAGLLERFYTDVCANVGLGKLVCATGRLIGNPQAIQRLRSRRLPPELVSKTRTFWQPNISYFLRTLTAGANAAQLYRANLQWQCRLGEKWRPRASARRHGCILFSTNSPRSFSRPGEQACKSSRSSTFFSARIAFSRTSVANFRVGNRPARLR